MHTPNTELFAKYRKSMCKLLKNEYIFTEKQGNSLEALRVVSQTFNPWLTHHHNDDNQKGQLR